jgi:hypothetical protein
MEMPKHKLGLVGRCFRSLKASAWSSRFDPILVVAILTLWVGVLPRLIVPDREHSDRGIYVSVAERLLAGDSLYSGVWDNKEPLFYYFVAAQRALGSWAEFTSEIMLIAIAVAAAYLMAIKVSSQWTAAAISFIAVPIILTGASYLPGFSELPGIALVLVAIVASAYRRPVLAGACLGLLVFMKLIYVPVALLGISCFPLARREFFDASAIALGAFAAALIVIAVLLARSELLPFIETIKLNIAYSQGYLIHSKKGFAVVVEHLRRIGRGAGGDFVRELAPISLAIALIVIALSGIRDRSRAQLAITGACVSTLVCSLLVLSLTGLWSYHKQILYIPTVFAVLGLASLLDVAANRTRLPTLGLVILTGYLMAGAPNPTKYFQSLQKSYAKLSWLSPEPQRLLQIGDTGTYARFGWGDKGHAIGLQHWKLACPRFHQAFHTPEAVLNKIFECASTSPTLLIASNFWPQPGWPSTKEFVTRVEHLLNESYSCDADSGLRICTRRLGPS